MHTLALHGATTGADLSGDVNAARAAGYDALEIPDVKLEAYLRAGGTLRELRRRCVDASLGVLAVGALEEVTLLTGDAFDRALERCATLCEWAAGLGAGYVLVVPSPRPAQGNADAIRRAGTAALRRLADVAARYDVRLGFEFLGFANCSVRTLSEAWQTLQEAGRDTIGLVIDSFHFYVGGSDLASLDTIDPRRIFFVHLNDAEPRPPAELSDAHRLFPGDGVIPLRQLVERLERVGYAGAYSLELFRPEYWEWDPVRVATIGRQKMLTILTPEA
jgi:2-keto-myo-inositol isomerase